MPEHRDLSPEDISEKPEETTGSGIFYEIFGIIPKKKQTSVTLYIQPLPATFIQINKIGGQAHPLATTEL